MPDEHSERIVRLLVEIRDLTKLRNDKLETMVQETRRRTDEMMQRYEEGRAEAKAGRLIAKKRFYISLAAVAVLVVIGCVLIFVLQ